MLFVLSERFASPRDAERTLLVCYSIGDPKIVFWGKESMLVQGSVTIPVIVKHFASTCEYAWRHALSQCQRMILLLRCPHGNTDPVPIVSR